MASARPPASSSSRPGAGSPLLTDFRYKLQAEQDVRWARVVLYPRGLLKLLPQLLPDLGITSLAFESHYTLHSTAEKDGGDPGQGRHHDCPPQGAGRKHAAHQGRGGDCLHPPLGAAQRTGLRRDLPHHPARPDRDRRRPGHRSGDAAQRCGRTEFLLDHRLRRPQRPAPCRARPACQSRRTAR